MTAMSMRAALAKATAWEMPSPMDAAKGQNAGPLQAGQKVMGRVVVLMGFSLALAGATQQEVDLSLARQQAEVWEKWLSFALHHAAG